MDVFLEAWELRRFSNSRPRAARQKANEKQILASLRSRSVLAEGKRERIHAARGVPALALIVLFGDEQQVLGLVFEPLSAAGGHGPEPDAAGADGGLAVHDIRDLLGRQLQFERFGIVLRSGGRPDPLLLVVLCLVLDVDRQLFF